MKKNEMVIKTKRFEVYLINLDPMTTKGRDYPSRVSCEFHNKKAKIVLDQISTVDTSRLVYKLGEID